jgi:hypothetical protein
MTDTGTATGTATGPKTEEGKQRSSVNAYKHGLTGQIRILNAEEKLLYDEHCQSYFELYKPVGHPERVLVENIADDYWRALRGRAFESTRLRLTMDGELDGSTPILVPSNVWIHNEKALSNLGLYIQRIERSIKNNTQALEAMQHQRKESQRQAEEEVKLLARAACAQGRTYDPAPDFPPERGFVFSTAQVAELVSRQDRLNEARLNEARQRQSSAFSPAVKPMVNAAKPAYRVFKAA